MMGFSCGLPLLLTLSVLQAWMREEGVDLGTIGLFALVGLVGYLLASGRLDAERAEAGVASGNNTGAA